MSGEKMGQCGYVYLAARNDGLFKIGLSKAPGRRMRELSDSTGFEHHLLASLHSPDIETFEKEIHALFKHGRLGSKTEVFLLDAVSVRDCVQCLGGYGDMVPFMKSEFDHVCSWDGNK